MPNINYKKLDYFNEGNLGAEVLKMYEKPIYVNASSGLAQLSPQIDWFPSLAIYQFS
jgi:hypothetical protein